MHRLIVGVEYHTKWWLISCGLTWDVDLPGCGLKRQITVSLPVPVHRSVPLHTGSIIYGTYTSGLRRAVRFVESWPMTLHPLDATYVRTYSSTGIIGAAHKCPTSIIGANVTAFFSVAEWSVSEKASVRAYTSTQEICQLLQYTNNQQQTQPRTTKRRPSESWWQYLLDHLQA